MKFFVILYALTFSYNSLLSNNYNSTQNKDSTLKTELKFVTLGLSNNQSKYPIDSINTQVPNKIIESSNEIFILKLALIFTVIMIVLLLYFLKKNKQQREKDIFYQKEMHHRVKNNLGMIENFINVATEETDNEQSKQKLKDLSARIYSIYEVHEQIYNCKTQDKLLLKKYTDNLILHIQKSLGNGNITINNSLTNNVQFTQDKVYVLGLILNEFLTNSFKHAFTVNQLGQINISMNENKECYRFELSDTGKGLANIRNFSSAKSYGLKMIKLLTKQLGGKLEAINNNGLKLSIILPK